MKYCIVNWMDRPYEKLICQVIDGKAYYLDRELRKRHEGMSIARATDIRDFGLTYTESNGFVMFVKLKDSTAKYGDGKTRHWQGSRDTIIKYLRSNVEDILSEYIKTVNKIEELVEDGRSIDVKFDIVSLLDQLTERLKTV